MFTRSSIGVPVIFVSSFLALSAHGARADEAYLCGPDKVVYVKIEELEHKKKTDKCIASYYGLTVEDGASEQVSSNKNTPSKSNVGPTIELKSLSEPEHDVRRSTTFERSATLMPPKASAGTDFRNIRVINAGSDENQWFKHNR